jgi:two-component system LytT family response regulator
MLKCPAIQGFQLLDFFREVNFEIVFTTAHSDYALQAFQVSAIDFLLKPIQISELLKAVEKLKKVQGLQKERMDTLKENFKDGAIKKIALPVSEGLIFIDVADIIYLEADGAYTNFHLAWWKENFGQQKN